MTPQNVSASVLRTLHRIHRQLTDLRYRLNRGPKQLSACQAHVKRREDLLAKAQADGKAARITADGKQLQLQASEDKIKDLRLKLNAAGSNREYQALVEQIAAAEMANSVLADEILETLEKIDEFQKEIAEAEAELVKAREKSEKIHRDVSRQEPVIRSDLERLESELKESEAALPATIQEVYRRVVRQRGEDALAAVEKEYCSGCHQHVPLNVCAEIMLSHPMFCKSCGRLLYVPDDDSPVQ